MKTHKSTIIQRMKRAASRVDLRYRVVAIGMDSRGKIIGIKTNSPRFKNRGWHAEERLIRSSPKSLSKITIARVGPGRDFLPIDPCRTCQALADKLGIKIESLEKEKGPGFRGLESSILGLEYLG